MARILYFPAFSQSLMILPDFVSLPLDCGDLPTPEPPKLAVFHCSFISPMFMFGADRYRPELREESFIGMMHYWFRALRGHYRTIGKIAKEENILFGSTDTRGKVFMTLRDKVTFQQQTSLTPHRSKKNGNTWKVLKEDLTKPAFKSGTFTITLPADISDLFKITCLLGGFGGRSRRGFGAISFPDIMFRDHKDLAASLLGLIKNHLSNPSISNPNLTLIDTKIAFAGANPELKFPYIRKIHIGQNSFSKVEDLLVSLNGITHKLNECHGNDYGSQMGKVQGGRLASPVIASIIKMENGEFLPIITQMHSTGKTNIQDEFIDQVLKLRDKK